MNNQSTKPKFSKTTLMAALIVAAWFVVTFIVLGIFKIQQGWPAYLTLIMFYDAGAKMENLKNIFVGGILGILLAAALPLVLGSLAPAIGVEGTVLLYVFIVIFLIIALGDAAHMFFNTSTFMYFTVALILPVITKPQALLNQTVQWLGVLIIGGLFYTGGVILFLKFLTRGEHEETKTTNVSH